MSPSGCTLEFISARGAAGSRSPSDMTLAHVSHKPVFAPSVMSVCEAPEANKRKAFHLFIYFAAVQRIYCRRLLLACCFDRDGVRNR